MPESVTYSCDSNEYSTAKYEEGTKPLFPVARCSISHQSGSLNMMFCTMFDQLSLKYLDSNKMTLSPFLR